MLAVLGRHGVWQVVQVDVLALGDDAQPAVDDGELADAYRARVDLARVVLQCVGQPFGDNVGKLEAEERGGGGFDLEGAVDDGGAQVDGGRAAADIDGERALGGLDRTAETVMSSWRKEPPMVPSRLEASCSWRRART